MLITAVFPIAKIGKKSKRPSIDELIKKIWCADPHTRILLSRKKE